MITEVLIIASSLNLGDVGHAKAIVKALETEQQAPITQKILDANAPLTPLEGHPSLILVVGEKGLTALKTLTIDPNAYVVFGTHQYTTELEGAQNIIKHVVIPQTAVCPPGVLEQFATRTMTFAVPTNNPSLPELKASYDSWEHPHKPYLYENYIVVMLPGDAPDESGVIHRFTIDSAEKLFHDVKKLWESKGKGHKILVQNGPRTGKYICSHEYQKGSDPAVAIDEVSRHFVELLDSAQIPNTFFNFAFEKDGEAKKAISYFNQLLYIAQTPEKENYFIVPGESVSLLGQIPLYLASDRVIVFHPDSMNAGHRKVFDLAVAKNYVSSFDEGGEVIVAPFAQKRAQDDAVQVARDILKAMPKTDSSTGQEG